MSDDRLKPCPFCGGEAELHEGQKHGRGWAQASCADSLCGTFKPGIGRTKELRQAEAIAAWNRRTTPPESGGQGAVIGWCKLTPNGSIAHFDGKPMFMAGQVGNHLHPTPVYAHPPAQASGAVTDSAALDWLESALCEGSVTIRCRHMGGVSLLQPHTGAWVDCDGTLRDLLASLAKGGGK